jgi:LysM repeat protein
METNNLASADQIYAGQTLTIPGSQDTDSRTASLASGSYVVRPGDTLYQIGTRFGLTVSDLVIANNLISPGQIYAGQVLRLPGAANAPLPAYTPQESASIHTVTRGETLTMIAARYGVSPWVLAQTNNLSNPSLLFVGQVLAIPGQHALNPIAAAAPAATRQIVVDVSDQRTYVYQDGQLLWSFLSSTGQPGLDTWRGDFQIQNKIPVAYASTWGITMPNWLGFYWAGSLQNGFHALPIQPDGSRLWEGWLGVPVSYGCVILSDADAQTLYNWAEVGVPVRVQD